jgi:hypothetical protein
LLLLKEGQTVTALLLPEAPAFSIEHLAAAIETQKEAGLKKFPIPLPPLLLQKLLDAPDIKVFLKTLPKQELKKITEFMNSDTLTPALRGSLNRPAARSAGKGDEGDQNLFLIIRAQIHTKTALQAIQTPATQMSPRTGVPEMPNIPLSLAENAEPLQTESLKMIAAHDEPPPPKNMYQVTVLKIFSPDTPPQKINEAVKKLTGKAALSPPQTAEVEAETSSQQPILKTADNKHFIIRTPVKIPVGTMIVMTSAPMTPKQEVAQETPPDFDPLLSLTWPALDEALHVMQQSNAPVAQALHRALPTPTPKLPAAALFFMAALRFGSIDKWLGDNILKTLKESGKKDLIERLSGDFKKISVQSKETLPGEWRSFSMPLLHDENLTQMQFHVRQQHDRDDGGKGGKQKPATRFILNLNLSRMGKMQLDGFIQKKNFDIILRTEEKLPAEMRQELTAHFAKGLDQVHMQGGIKFQAKRQGWVQPEIGSLKTEI